MRRTLAKIVLTLAAANAALTGCQPKREQDAKSGDPQAEQVTKRARKDGEKKEESKQDATRVAHDEGERAAYATQPGDDRNHIDHGVNPWTDTAVDNKSTFAADVDNASYTLARRYLNEGNLPPTAAVRVEEFVNFFDYDYAAPGGGAPFAVHADAAPSPLHPGRHVVRIGVTTKAKSIAERKPANLVFLVDVSGSMSSDDKIGLAKRSLRVLVENLHDGDTVSLVTYAGSTRVVLEPTGIEHRDRILSAIEDLTAGGSTAMASGIDLAYQQAMKTLSSDSISRVVILSDGDANVGPTSHEEILASIASRVSEGITLSTIGFGMGNYQDDMMEQLGDKGNGNNYYVDTLDEARRIFQEQLSATLEVVAQDVKLQVEFDPAVVARYRLVGYENRDIADQDFRKDEVDAGEIGAGHQVTAVYEIEKKAGAGDDLLTVRIRHKAPRGVDATESTFDFDPAKMAPSLAAASPDLQFAFAVAAFAEVLRGSEDSEHWSLAKIREVAAAGAGDHPDRKDLLALIDKAITLRSGTAMVQ